MELITKTYHKKYFFNIGPGIALVMNQFIYQITHKVFLQLKKHLKTVFSDFNKKKTAFHCY